MSLSLAPYPLALLKLMEDEQGSPETHPLGFAVRAGMEKSTFRVPAHRFLHALITYAPSSKNIAQEFLRGLGQCRIQAVEMSALAVIAGSCAESPEEWAAAVHQQLRNVDCDLSCLTQLGTHYFTHLVVAFRNPGGKKTPQDTVHPTPDIRRIEDIQELLEQATLSRSQSALKDLASADLSTDSASFVFPQPVVSRCAHVIPFSVHSKTQTHSAIEAFSGHGLSADFVLKYINNPRNALNLETNSHNSMNKHLAWGIEAKLSDNKCRYYYRVVREDAIAPFIRLRDGDEIAFGLGAGGDKVTLPDPMICNLHLAIARVSYASGVSEIFDQFLEEDGGSEGQVPIYFGGPFVSDDMLMHRLESLVC